MVEEETQVPGPKTEQNKTKNQCHLSRVNPTFVRDFYYVQKDSRRPIDVFSSKCVPGHDLN